MQPLHVVVVGGGAAGFFGAIACAEAHPHTQVTLLEASRYLLNKVRISGGGRCNVTHACFDPAQLVQHYPRGGKALRGAFTRFQPEDTVRWFQRRGVALKTESDGRIFPVTDDSSTIVDCLMQAADDRGIVIKTNCPVLSVTHSEAGFQLEMKGGGQIQCDRLLLATGSQPQGYKLAQSLGHEIEPPVPSLFTFNVPESPLRELAGVSVDAAQVQLAIPGNKPLQQIGPVLITHWGLSGPAVLKLSAWGARLLHDQQYQAEVQINWLPEMPLESLRTSLMNQKTDGGKRAIASQSPFALPRRLWQFCVARAGIEPETRWAEVSKAGIQQLITELHHATYVIQGKGVFKEEFVTCGGVSLKQVDFKTMGSRCCHGLYFAGEILDIDGVTGGFNFQSAWTTGWLAGQAIGQT